MRRSVLSSGKQTIAMLLSLVLALPNLGCSFLQSPTQPVSVMATRSLGAYLRERRGGGTGCRDGRTRAEPSARSYGAHPPTLARDNRTHLYRVAPPQSCAAHRGRRARLRLALGRFAARTTTDSAEVATFR